MCHKPFGNLLSSVWELVCYAMWPLCSLWVDLFYSQVLLSGWGIYYGRKTKPRFLANVFLFLILSFPPMYSCIFSTPPPPPPPHPVTDSCSWHCLTSASIPGFSVSCITFRVQPAKAFTGLSTDGTQTFPCLSLLYIRKLRRKVRLFSSHTRFLALKTSLHLTFPPCDP